MGRSDRTCADCKTPISRYATRCKPCQNKRQGLARRKTMAERLEGAYDEIDRGYSTPCWVWNRAVDRSGYGHIHLGHGKMVQAHKAVWELEMERTVPPGHDLHHECEVKLCVRPDHLAPLTRGEHMRRDGRLQRLHEANERRWKNGGTRGRDRDGGQAGGTDRQATGGLGEDGRSLRVLRRGDDEQDLHHRPYPSEGQRRLG